MLHSAATGARDLGTKRIIFLSLSSGRHRRRRLLERPPIVWEEVYLSTRNTMILVAIVAVLLFGTLCGCLAFIFAPLGG